MRAVLADAMLAAGVVLELVAVAGTVAMGDAYERLHFAGPASLGAVAMALAVLLQSGPSLIAVKAGLVAAFFLLTAPFLAHYTARAIREWNLGDWRPVDEEIEEDR